MHFLELGLIRIWCIHMALAAPSVLQFSQKMSHDGNRMQELYWYDHCNANLSGICALDFKLSHIKSFRDPAVLMTSERW